jgi:hypothetical protein
MVPLYVLLLVPTCSFLSPLKDISHPRGGDMKRHVLISTALLAFLHFPAFAQQPYYCGWTRDSSDIGIQPMINVQETLAIVFVDFRDGRLPSGEPPSDTTQLGGLNLEAVGSFGWVVDSSVFPPVYARKIRKYAYEDYWDRHFSDSAWVGDRHPDFASHNGYPGLNVPEDQRGAFLLTTYGSVRDYWAEVSYGNMQIVPAETRSGGTPIYDSGIRLWLTQWSHLTHRGGSIILTSLMMGLSQWRENMPTTRYLLIAQRMEAYPG